jgi:hypothetical protein
MAEDFKRRREDHEATRMTDNVYCLGCGAAFPIDADPYPLNGGMCAPCVAEGRKRPWQIIAENERLRTRCAEADALLRHAYADAHPEDVPMAVLHWLNPDAR